MTRTTAGNRMNWCGRCHHAIVPVGGIVQGWGHFSDDDWSGWGDCACTEQLTPCHPGARSPLASRVSWGRVTDIAMLDQLSLLSGRLWPRT